MLLKPSLSTYTMSLGNRFCMLSYLNSLTFSLEMILLRPYHSSPWACSSPASSSSKCRHLKARSLQGQLADHQGLSAVESAPLRSLHGRAESPWSTCRSSISSLPQSWSQAGWSQWLTHWGPEEKCMNQRATCSPCDEKWRWQADQTVAGFCSTMYPSGKLHSSQASQKGGCFVSRKRGGGQWV